MGILCKMKVHLKKATYNEINMENADDLVVCLCDFHGHEGKYINGHSGDHGGYEIGYRILEGRMLLGFCLEKELCVSKTSFKKAERGR